MLEFRSDVIGNLLRPDYLRDARQNLHREEMNPRDYKGLEAFSTPWYWFIGLLNSRAYGCRIYAHLIQAPLAPFGITSQQADVEIPV